MINRTPEQRARYALSKSCNGWRRNRTCIDAATRRPLDTPHPACVRAQEEHDQILTEAGLLDVDE
jgi:hypothetical protein